LSGYAPFENQNRRSNEVPKLSIGLPVHNGENYLQAALDSLLGQTFDDFELIICDNASTDATAEISKRAANGDRRVRLHQNSRNLGAGPNFNLAFHLSGNTEYFKWAAHDDICYPTYLQRCIEGLDREPESVLAHTDVELIGENANDRQSHDEELPLVGADRPSVRFEDLILSDHWCTAAFGVIRRESLLKTPLLRSYVGADRVLLAQLGLYGRFCWIPEVLFQNRDHHQRSVHASSPRSYERLAWFNPALRDRGIRAPYLRCWLEYAHVVSRAPIALTEKIACLRALVRWIPSNRWEVRNDIEHVLRALLAQRRLVARGSQPIEGKPSSQDR
jgi:glycosyltransferase involved in cell wall biosynthesis